MTAVLLALFLAVARGAGELRHFVPTPISQVPRSLVASVLCPDSEEGCLDGFRRTGAAWAGDVNGDGVNELLVHPGLDYAGSGGRWYFLYQERQGRWVSLFFDEPGGEGWQERHPRFDILPIVRNGYHDLRISHDTCLKWNGERYDLYEASDYHRLSPDLFDATNPAEAEILWKIRYSGLARFGIEPHWFRPGSSWTDSSINSQVEDAELGLRWVAFFKGGVWGVKGEERFLLLPQPAYLGASKLQLSGHWLLIHGEAESDDAAQPVARYNRRTSRLEILHGASPEE